MKRLLLVPSLVALFGSLATAAPLGTAFTYQGKLTDGGPPANGSYDLRFILYDAGAGGSQVGPILTNAAVPVTGGLFAVPLDFGGGLFTGSARWLEIAVRTNGGGAFATLVSRQPLTPAPNALYAPNAGTAALASAVAPGAVSGPGIADAQVVRSVNTLHDAVTLAPGTNVTLSAAGNVLTISATPGSVVTNAGWGLNGNAGTTVNNFLGTTDGQALNLRVNNARAWRLEPGASAPNVIGGYAGNVAAAGISGATIGGGGAAGSVNTVSNNWATIAGGYANLVQGQSSTIGGGTQNTIMTNNVYATIAGGKQNTIAAGANYASIAGGGVNQIDTGAYSSSIGGGAYNEIWPDAHYAVLSGGLFNSASAESSFLGGGIGNTTAGLRGVVVGGRTNLIALTGDDSFIGGGWTNTIFGTFSTIVGGAHNSVAIGASCAAIGGGSQNDISGGFATIGGGLNNSSGGAYATVPGGDSNTADGLWSLAAGRRAKALHSGTFVWADSTTADFASTGNDQFLIRAAKVGINNNSPVGTLHVTTRANLPGLVVQNGYGEGSINLINNYGDQATLRCARDPGDPRPYVQLDVPGNYLVVWADGARTANEFWCLAVHETSDRNRKTNLEAVNPAEVLEHVLSLPVSTWAFTNAVHTRHLGPMAQDFRAAFGLGDDDKTIGPRDANGVALAAIQGLNQKLEEKNAALEKRVAELKALVETLAQKVNRGAQ